MSGKGHEAVDKAREVSCTEVEILDSSRKRKRKRIINKENQLTQGFIRVARCFKRKKAADMGSGCTKNAASNVIKPVERDSTFSVEGDRKVKKLSVPLRGSTSCGNEEFINHTSKSTINDEKQASETEKISTAEDINISTNNNAMRDANVNITRSSVSEDSLKHYRGQTNLLHLKPMNKRNSADDVFEITSLQGDEEVKSQAKRDKRMPPLPPRYKRQPTIHNSVCFQEDDQINHYQIQEEIGRGSYAAVYKCLSSKTNETYAMKVISKKRLIRKNGLMARHPRKGRTNPLDGLHREIAILKKVDHPNIVKLVEVIDDPEIDNVYMVFEMMKRGPAQEIPTDSPMSEEKARRYFRDMVLGMEYLHHTRIVHRDIKPSNLLLGNDDHVKIADFGVSDMFEDDDDMLNRFAGSPAFQSPEETAEGRSKFSGKATDIWAMGITLYAFVYGKCPFYDQDILSLYEKIRNDELEFPEEPIVNPQLHDLICRLLAKDAKQRIQMADIKNHPWLTQGGREPLPPTNEHCNAIEVTEEDVKNSITLISRLSSLVLVKTMLKRRTFSSSKKHKKSSVRSNSTPDIGNVDENYFTNRTKSATLMFAAKSKPS